MSEYLGEITEIGTSSGVKFLVTSQDKKINLDPYHQILPVRKGDSVLVSGGQPFRLLFMIPSDRDSVVEIIKNPVSGLPPVFANMIVSESEKFIEKKTLFSDISKEKILSGFFNMVVWKEYYWSHRGRLFSDILNNNVPKPQINKFIKYWLEEHLMRQFSLWGLSPEETKILIEDVYIAEKPDLDIGDLIIMISKYPGRFLYVHPGITREKILHLTTIFGSDPIPMSIERIKKQLNDTNDSYITFTEDHRKSLGKNLGLLGSYGIKVFDNNTKMSLLSTYNIEKFVAKCISQKIRRCNYEWKTCKAKPSLALALDHEGLSEEQRDGLIMTLMNPISIFTGGPGCGKTILIRALIKEALARGIPYHVAAFTGKAVGRVKEAAYPDIIESSTIDMMLVQGPSHYKFNLLILEEASMITTKYMYRLFKKFNPLLYNIVVVGDLDQIPPIDKGHFFSSLIWSKRVPYIRLTKNFRVDSDIGGDIIRNAAMIVNPMRDLRQPIDLDIETNSFNILRGNIDTIRTILKGFGRENLNSITVMAPYNDDVNVINKVFQEIKYGSLSGGPSDGPSGDPSGSYLFDKGIKWYLEDRIMITENSLAENFANGDLGTIKLIDPKKGVIEVALDKDEERRRFTSKNFSMIKHSYCFTINKSQGSEYDGVILYLPNKPSNEFFLNMNLIYTAITRARKIVWIIVEDPMTLINACNKRIPISTDILKDSLKIEFPDKEYIGTLVEYVCMEEIYEAVGEAGAAADDYDGWEDF